MDYRGVFFDFDYTLGDSTPAITQGYRLGFQALGWPPPTEEQVRPTIGMTLADGYTLLTGDGDEGRRQAFADHFHSTVGPQAGPEGQKLMTEGTTLFPGAAGLLEGLRARGVRAAIVSTKPRILMERIFAFRGLDHLLDLMVGGGDVERAKPDPEGLELALARLGVGRREALFCGDTVIDARTAQNAGVDFCAVLNGTTPAGAFDGLPHVYIARDLLELKRWLGV